ncbi:SGNH/GDSL hydrolase family protein [Ferrovum myxofaciens]|uniref:GDSL-like lipase/acylhydrolase n=1 Tax=Ferrovum myxofaciens TaxID=416213 RepID=A0A8F3E0M6_9PROT|nr:SGNH/GDSL hydrolase family protein [Ferrovum myxofaciens]KXW58755.1 GDSL-like lipase/acylhydrolase [Ferrovum myxofaciens]MBU6994918.1 SGNH/GDSL hydrolase family protein [Ferrovum myxofaciens]QKE38726.1 MAG: SGNH/GDSL hydrolase family protein [Ferrovum myxofaciens]QWY73930.1 MAG: SGNH/GDSL hydrolase family protein [Ferrovum myxofaciens]QWY76683.1 MAG: SGNH/GDSL hydrolase family protein [Ferrovum myxofaciens]
MTSLPILLRHTGSRWFCALFIVCLQGCSPEPPAHAQNGTITPPVFNTQSPAPHTPPNHGFSALVAFGDSLSDLGTYTVLAERTYGLGTSFDIPFTGLPYPAGGQFTVNGTATGNWVGDLAQRLNLDITPNLIGFGGPPGSRYLTPMAGFSRTPVFCPFGFQTADHSAFCLDFAEGGALISNPIGIDHNRGALTLPLTQQVSQYLHQFQRFRPDQLVTVFGGNNDVLLAFTQFLSNITESVQQRVASAKQNDPAMGPVRQQEIATQALGQEYQTALVQAQHQIDQAADDLAKLTLRIIDHGARYVLIYTLPDSAETPFGRGLPYTLRDFPQPPPTGYVCHSSETLAPCNLLSRLVNRFNQRLLDNLQGKPVKIFDSHQLFGELIAHPETYGFTHATIAWCAPKVPSSLLCNLDTPNKTAGATVQNLSSWLFADDIHPTPAGYQVLADQTWSELKYFGWIAKPPLP